ncbi:MAG: NAD(+) diphosphatase, partial [Pseudomonadota bacterium]|nr:NAD(+) diphosphatase [Pseudomonadota bacterium]
DAGGPPMSFGRPSSVSSSGSSAERFSLKPASPTLAEGESLEDAVTREVIEEVGIRISDVHYHSSQPWPFPSSIMLGFYGRAEEINLQVDTFELESARWFSRDEIRNCPNDDGFRLPRTDSISRRLIEDWVAEG